MIVPEIPYERIAARVRSHWNPHEFNPHQSFFGISRSGKSFLIRHGILPIAGASRIVVLDVKPGGAKTWNGYGNDVEELKPGFGIGSDGTPHYRLFATNRQRVQCFIEMIAHEGSCIVVIDDSRRITANTPDYGLAGYVDELLLIGAEIGVTVLICANSSVWSTSGARDQCIINWIGLIANEDECKKLIRYAKLPKEVLPTLVKMRPRQFLYSDKHDGPVRLALTQYQETNHGHTMPLL